MQLSGGCKWMRAVRRVVGALLICAGLICIAAPRARAGSDALWVADSFDAQVDEYLPSALKSSGERKVIIIPTGERAWGVCFDKSKNLWVTAGDTSTTEEILGYTAAALKTLPSAITPAVTITSSTFDGVGGCTFDKRGNLWLADYEADSLDEISAEQLEAGSGSITPAVVITSSSTPLDEPSFVAFDASGNLWTASQEEGAIFEFSASQLSSGGAQLPAGFLTGGGDLDAPAGIGFDKHGNLWVANDGNGTVVMFPKGHLGDKYDAPTVTISSSSLDGPWGLVFKSSDLWVLNYGNGTAQKFVPSQLKRSGAPAAKGLLAGIAGDGNWQITFGPAYGK